MKRTLLMLSAILIAGCSAHQSTAAPPTTSPTDTSTAAGQCADSDLEVTNGDVASANTLRYVTVSFKNTSPHPCALVGYPGADLVTAAGGVLVPVARRPARTSSPT